MTEPTATHPRAPARAVPLADVFTGLDVQAPADPPESATGAAMDSRLVQPGDIYIAVPGANVHGASFAQTVQRQGAVAIVTDPEGVELAADSGLPVFQTPDPRVLAGIVASRAFSTPSTDLRIVGITGTNGKTTMSFLLASVLQAAGQTTGVIGTTGHFVANERIPSQRTTPEAPEVHALLAYMRSSGVTTVVMEVSSHAMGFGRVNGVEFDLAVFTNLTQDHLDYHGSMAAYFEAKADLFARAKTSVICIDDEWGRQLAERFGSAQTYAVAGDPTSEATWWADGIEDRGDRTDFQLHQPEGKGPGEALAASVSLPGLFNVANAVGAIATAANLGVAVPTAIAGIAQCRGVPGRMQRVPNAQDVRAFVDYAHTPDAVGRAIEAVTGRKLVVLGCGGDRDRDKRQQMGKVAAELADVVIVTDDNPRTEDPTQIRAAVIAGTGEVAEAARARVLEVADRREAIRIAVAEAKPGDALLVLGKGHEQGQTVGTTVLPFDDVEVLAGAFEEAGS